MKAPPPDEPAGLLHQLREQLILAQVRIMELEDGRDDFSARQTEVEALLQGAQTLADQKTEALAHLEGVHRDLEAQFQHLRHVQHVTNEALNDIRAQLQAAKIRLQSSAEENRLAQTEIVSQQEALAARQRELAATQERAADLGARLDALDARARQLDTDLAGVNATAAARLQRITELDAELRAMKASRSWRWTQAVRAVERWIARRRRP